MTNTKLSVQVSNDFVQFSTGCLFCEPYPRNRSPERARDAGERVEAACVYDPCDEIQKKKEKTDLSDSSQA